MRKSALTAIFLAVVTVATPAAARPADMSDLEIKHYGDKYLSIGCPVIRAAESHSRAWEQAFGRTVSPGDYLPGYYRAAAARLARAESRAAVRMNKTNWPTEVSGPAERLEYGAYFAAPVYRSISHSTRWTHALSRDWKKVPSTRPAAIQIRRALELPPPGEGCGRG